VTLTTPLLGVVYYLWATRTCYSQPIYQIWIWCLSPPITKIRKVMQNVDKLALYGTDVDSSELTFMPTSKSCDTITMPNTKNPAWSNLHIVP